MGVAVGAKRLGDLFLTLPFVLLFCLNLAHHQLWLDELNAWGISAASPTLSALFANVHYEGHPWLWYFLLWLPSRFTADPIAMKWVEASIGCAICLVIGTLSPFPRGQKILLLLNYFIVFEYTVISRTYGLMLLFALLYIRRRAAKPDAWIGNLALLGALANSDLTGIMLSGALGLEYAVSQWPKRREWKWPETGLALAIYCALLAVSVRTLLPAPDISWFTTGRMFSKAGSFQHLSHCIADVVVASWWPLARDFPRRFWDTDVEFNKSAIVFVPVVLAAYGWTFRKHRNLLVLMGASLAFALAFAHLIYLGYVRHWGITVVAFLCAFWLLWQDEAQRRDISRVAYLFLAIGSLKGVAAVASSWTHPFSEIDNAVLWLREHHLENQPIAGSSDFALAGVAEELQRPAYFLDCNCVDTYMKFAHRRDGMTEDQIPERVLRAFDAWRTERLVLVMDSPLALANLARLEQAGVDVRPLAQFSGSEDGLKYYLYSSERATPPVLPRK